MSILAVVDDALHLIPTLATARNADAIDETAIDMCDGTYTCDCIPCQADRTHRVRMGVKPSRPLPIRRDRRLAA